MVVSQEQRSLAVLSGWWGGGSIPAARYAGSPRAAQGQFITKILNCSCGLLAKVNIRALSGNLGIQFGSNHQLKYFLASMA